MQRYKDKILTDKGEFMVNFLLAGMAMKFLAEYTDKSEEWWMEELSNEANKQYEEMMKNDSKQIEKIIDIYVEASTKV